MTQDVLGIVGSSHSAHALAAYLSKQGHRVILFARDMSKLGSLQYHRRLRAEGHIEGEFELYKVTDQWKILCTEASVIFLATVTTAYREMIPAMAPYLKRGQVIVAFSSKLCGSLEIDHGLRSLGVDGVRVMETDALFACRLREPGVIWIRGFKAWNLYACPRQSDTREFGPLLTRYFPGLEAAENLVQRGLTDFGAHAHAIITLANISRIDRAEEFLFYHEGLSPRTVVLLERLADEFRQVARAYGTDVIPLPELLNRYYGCSTHDVLTAMQTVPNYRHSLAPRDLNHRYLVEDVSCTLVPLSELALKAGVKTPMVDAVITLASALSGRELRMQGRRLGSLGWETLLAKEVMRWMEG